MSKRLQMSGAVSVDATINDVLEAIGRERGRAEADRMLKHARRIAIERAIDATRDATQAAIAKSEAARANGNRFVFFEAQNEITVLFAAAKALMVLYEGCE